MIKKYCDRCGKEIKEENELYAGQCSILSEYDINIYKKRKTFSQNCSTGFDMPVDLCPDCKDELEETVADFLHWEGEIIGGDFAKAHECCGGCID